MILNMNTKSFLFLLILVLGTFSCSNRNTAEMLKDIESYIQERPDSALVEIQSIDTTSLNTRELRAKYSLLHAMALDKNYINASNIQIIEPALRFYTHKGRYRMLANFYAGRIYENNQDYANALIHYNDALDNASEQEYLYLGLIHSYIANVYHSTYAFKEELLHKEIASECFEKLGEQHYIDLGIFGLANAWHNNHNFQKADSLYREICEQGDSLRSIAILAKIARADNAIKSEKYDPNEILKLYEFALENSGEMSLEDYYEYAYILTKLGYHADANNILEQLSVYPATYASYWWRYKIEQEKGNLNNAASMLEESIKLQNNVVKEKISQSVFKSQSEFYRHAMLSTQQEKTIQRQRYSLVFLLLILAFSFLAFLYFKRRRQLSEENERLLLAVDESERMLRIMELDSDNIRVEFSKTISQIEEQASVQNRKVLELQKMYAGLYQKQFSDIGKYFDVSYLVNPNKASQKIIKQVSSKINEILSEISAQSGKQTKFESRINRDADNIIAKIRKDYPKYSEDDIRFICYIIAGFDTTTISVLMDISGENARVKKHRIRSRMLRDNGENAALYKIWFE